MQGLEDHLGDMDFKVAGTKDGITALQMDIKIKGITEEILRKALIQAHSAREKIMKVVTDCIPEPRKEVSKWAPKMATFNIDPDKIRDIIGPQGKVINDIIAKCNDVKIDINDDGKVVIYHTDRESINKAKEMIENIVRVAKVGEIFEGTVVRIESFGCFVNLFGNVDGLCHVSKLLHTRVNHPKDVVKIGQKLKVIVTDIDEKGRINLSHKEFEPKPEKPEKVEIKIETSEENHD
ncbi:MAG: S1 RNA-binding domain-containing protein [Bacilli bacterium]